MSYNVLDHVLESFRSPLNDIEHSKLYVGWVGYLPGPVFRALDGANKRRRGFTIHEVMWGDTPSIMKGQWNDQRRQKHYCKSPLDAVSN